MFGMFSDVELFPQDNCDTSALGIDENAPMRPDAPGDDPVSKLLRKIEVLGCFVQGNEMIFTFRNISNGKLVFSTVQQLYTKAKMVEMITPQECKAIFGTSTYLSEEESEYE